MNPSTLDVDAVMSTVPDITSSVRGESVNKDVASGTPRLIVLSVSGLAGAMDVDAITLSLSSDGSGLERTAAALIIALLANTAFKCAVVLVVGRGAVRRQVAVASVAMAITGIVATSLALS